MFEKRDWIRKEYDYFCKYESNIKEHIWLYMVTKTKLEFIPDADLDRVMLDQLKETLGLSLTFISKYTFGFNSALVSYKDRFGSLLNPPYIGKGYYYILSSKRYNNTLEEHPSTLGYGSVVFFNGSLPLKDFEKAHRVVYLGGELLKTGYKNYKTLNGFSVSIESFNCLCNDGLLKSHPYIGYVHTGIRSKKIRSWGWDGKISPIEEHSLDLSL
jgi:hypothetical protein